MRRNEACAYLTMLASDELIHEAISKDILKARDVVVCENNTILDVLADDDIRRYMKAELLKYLGHVIDTPIFSDSVRGKAEELKYILKNKPDYSQESFEYYCKCDHMFIPTRCKKCPNYIGNEE